MAKALPNHVRTLGAVLHENKGIGPGFDFLRIFLATCIVAIHAFQLTNNDIWMRKSAMWFAVDSLVPLFFALSGFLVAGSAMRLTLGNFLTNRGLRIIPALGVDVLVCALIIGPIVTTLSLSAYFSDAKFYSYFWNVTGYIHYLLPGVFETHHSVKVNGALWTVPYEILCYILMSIFMVTGLLKDYRKTLVVALGMVSLCVIFGFSKVQPLLSASANEILYFLFVSRESQIVTAFILGIVAYQLRDSIPYSRKLFALAIFVFLVASFFPDIGRMNVARFATLPALVYIMAFVGLTEVWIPKYFKSGDYSYGVYLYHDPILQVVIGAFPAVAAVQHFGGALVFLIAIPLVVFFASFSWHVIEKPILGLRKKFSFVASMRGAT